MTKPRLLSLLAVLTAGCSRVERAPAPAHIRVATYNASLYRDAPGVLLDAIKSGDPQVEGVAAVLRAINADIILVNEIDADHEVVDAFVEHALPRQGYSHRFVPPSNTGVPTGLDLDRDGHRDGPSDARGFGHYRGQYGMALLSRFPIVATSCFGDRLWASFPWASLPNDPNTDATDDWYDAQALAVLPLSSKNHCDVELATPLGSLHALISHPTPPAFDGAEDRNGYRNRDEIRAWGHYVDTLDPQTAFIILGDLNADPHDSDSAQTIADLLAHPRVLDPRPASEGARVAAITQGGRNAAHVGDPKLDTADWDDTHVGNLRVDYALPSATLRVRDAGVHWPLAEAGPSDHHAVWVDVLPVRPRSARPSPAQ